MVFLHNGQGVVLDDRLTIHSHARHPHMMRGKRTDASVFEYVHEHVGVFPVLVKHRHGKRLEVHVLIKPQILVNSLLTASLEANLVHGGERYIDFLDDAAINAVGINVVVTQLVLLVNIVLLVSKNPLIRNALNCSGVGNFVGNIGHGQTLL